MDLWLEGDSLRADFCDELAAILQPFTLPPARIAASSALAGSSVPTAVESPQAACPVMIRYRRSDAEGCIMLGQQWTVSLQDDLLQRLKSEFGRNRVTVQYRSN
jgi:hypothetical protein